MRLDSELVDAARAVARRQRRTVPGQIEYWAEIGRNVEAVLDPTSLIQVQEGLGRLVVELVPSAAVSPTEVFAELERARSEGSLSGGVTQSKVRYQASAAQPGFLEEVRADGSRVIGRFSGGRFVPNGK